MPGFRETVMITVVAVIGVFLFVALGLSAYALYLVEGGHAPRRARRALTDPAMAELKGRLSPVAGILLVQKAFSRAKPL